MNEFQVILHNTSGLPRDDAVNVLHYDITIPDTDQGIADDIHTAYANLAPRINSVYQGMTIKAYDPGTGPPKRITNYGFNPQGSSGPTEVALCLSYKSDDSGNPRRRKGRIYLPVKNNAAARPDANIISDLLDFGEALANVGSASNSQWRMRSKLDGSFHNIDHISVDNEWDTQRRRGMRADTRTARAV